MFEGNIDTFKEMWKSQDDFMQLLIKHRKFPQYPVDLTSKEGQQHVKNVINDTIHELFEAVHLLKNSKNHRKTEINVFDKDEFIEELVDAQKFLLEALLLSGIELNEFLDSFKEKTKINVERILGDY